MDALIKLKDERTRRSKGRSGHSVTLEQTFDGMTGWMVPSIFRLTCDMSRPLNHSPSHSSDKKERKYAEGRKGHEGHDEETTERRKGGEMGRGYMRAQTI